MSLSSKADDFRVPSPRIHTAKCCGLPNAKHLSFFLPSFFFHPPRESRLKGASNAAHVRVVGPCRKARNKHILDHLLSLMLLLTTEIARAHTHGFCKAVVAAHGSKGVVASALSISYLGKNQL